MSQVINEIAKFKLGDNYLCNLYVHNKTGNEQKILLYDLSGLYLQGQDIETIIM